MKPILFNTSMVQAIRSGKKTQTRRVCNESVLDLSSRIVRTSNEFNENEIYYICIDDKGYALQDIAPQYQINDILYVRETHCICRVNPEGKLQDTLYYKADGDLRPIGWQSNWTPSIHMRKEYAREFLKVINVKLERIQNTSISDILAEGVTIPDEEPYRPIKCFSQLWDSTVTDKRLYSWSKNPWVWAYEFKRISKEEAYKEEER